MRALLFILLSCFYCIVFSPNINAACTVNIYIEDEDDNDICLGSNIVVKAGLSDCDDIGDITFEWEGGISGNDILVIENIESSRTISVAIKDQDGNVIDTDEIDINVFGNFTVEVVIDPNSEALCDGNSISLIANITGANVNDLNFEWNNGIFQNDDQVVDNNVDAGPETYSVTVYDEGNCEVIASENITIHELPDVDITGDLSYCIGDDLSLNPGNNGVDCSWTLPNQSNYDFCDLNLEANPGTYVVEVTDINGCLNTDQVSISVVDPQLELDLGSNANICDEADPFELELSVLAGNYSISPSNQGNPFEENNFDPTQIPPGLYTITYTLDVGPCSGASTSAQINIMPLPLVDWDSEPIKLCLNSDAIDLFQFVSPNTGNFFINNQLLPNGIFDPADFNEGTMMVEYIVVTECENSVSKTIELFAPLVAIAEQDFTVCNGANPRLGVSVTGGFGSPVYNWSPAGLLDDNEINSPTVPNISSTQEFTVDVTDEINCAISATQRITVVPQPEVFITMNPEGICEEDTPTLTANVNGGHGTPTFYWNEVGDSPSVSNMNFFTTPPIINNTNYEVTVKYESGNAECNDASFGPFLIIPQDEPAPNINMDDLVVCSNQTSIFIAEDRKNNSTFDWSISSPQPNIISTESLGPLFIVHWGENIEGASTTVEVIEKLSNDCEGKDEIEIDFISGVAPELADIFLVPEKNILVYNDSTVCAYKWGYYDPDDGEVETELPNNHYQSYKPEPYVSERIYFCQVWNGDCPNLGCTTTAIFRESNANPTPEENENKKFLLYPNPNLGTFTLEVNKLFPNAVHQIDIYNSMGKMIQSLQVKSQYDKIKLLINTLEKTAGVYHLALRFNGEIQQVESFIIYPN